MRRCGFGMVYFLEKHLKEKKDFFLSLKIGMNPWKGLKSRREGGANGVLLLST
jgi:hypothetical protein